MTQVMRAGQVATVHPEIDNDQLEPILQRMLLRIQMSMQRAKQNSRHQAKAKSETRTNQILVIILE
jgi:DNA-binding TFAR19-related protein (PDSD5 family)